MRAVVTRVSSASVAIEGETVGKIGKGFLVLLGVGPEDTEALADKMADKICGLRVFSDEAGKMNLNLAAAGGELLGLRAHIFDLCQLERAVFLRFAQRLARNIGVDVDLEGLVILADDERIAWSTGRLGRTWPSPPSTTVP